MLEAIGSWMDYNTQTRHKIISDHAYELDVAWLSGKNPEVAIEVQISGNITEAKDRLAQARKFNYRKVIMVLKEKDLKNPDAKAYEDLYARGNSGIVVAYSIEHIVDAIQNDPMH